MELSSGIPQLRKVRQVTCEVTGGGRPHVVEAPDGPAVVPVDPPALPIDASLFPVEQVLDLSGALSNVALLNLGTVLEHRLHDVGVGAKT